MRRAILIIIFYFLAVYLYSQALVEISTLEAKLITAKNDYLIGKIDDAISGFAYVVEQLEITKSQRPLIEREANIYIEALNYLAQCYLNSGKEQEAQYYFAVLIQYQPNYELDAVLTPAKVVNFYNSLKKSLVGYISMIVNPSDAIIYVDQKQVGVGSIEKYPLMAGTHSLLLERAGYKSETKELIVYASKVSQLGIINLKRESSVCFITTYPAEVEVVLDGVTIGFTSKGAPFDLADYARRNKLDLDNFSAYFPIEINDPLDHVIEFKKPCYQNEQIIIKYTEFKDYFSDPIILKPSYAQLELESDTDGKVYVDGGLVGELKQKTFKVCAGTHKLLVKAGWGNYSSDFDIKESDTQKIKVDIKPALLYMGIISDEGISEFVKKHTEERMVENLKKLRGIAVLNKAKEKMLTKAGELSAEDIAKNILKDTRAGNYDRLRSQIEVLRDNTDTHLFLFGHIKSEKIAKTVVFYLFSDLITAPDIYQIEIEYNEGWKEYFSLLESEMPLYTYFLPLLFVDSLVYEYPIILEILDNSIGTIQVGDLIRAVDKKPISSSAELQNKLEEGKENKLELEIYSWRNKSSQYITIPLKLAANEIAFSNRKMLINKQLINLLKYTVMEDERVSNLAIYNSGLLYYKMQEYEKALQYFKKVKEIKGVNLMESRIQYRIAQCYYELGLKKEAKEIFNKLEKETQLTLESKYSPTLSFLAKSYLKLLE